MSATDGKFDVSNYEGEFIRALREEGAHFLVVGGRAIRFYRPKRETHDLDILVGDDGENLGAVIAAMGRIDPRYFRRDWPKAHVRPNVQAHVDLRQTHGDVLTSIPGVDFESAWDARIIAHTDAGYEIAVISLQHLIANKQADAGRDPKACVDLALLQN